MLPVPGEDEPWIVTGDSFFQGGHFQDMPGHVAALRLDGTVVWTTSGPEIEAGWRALEVGPEPR